MDNILQASVIPGLCTSHTVYRYDSSLDADQDQYIIGGYFQDGTLCWLAKGALLTILSHSTCKVVSYKNFGNLFPRNSNCRIISCKPYNDLLLVGLIIDDEKSMVCLFNHRICKILKAIYIPFSITCIEVVLEEGGATHSSKPFAANLRWFFGVVAVGTTCGHLYLIDLRLDDNNFFQDFSPATIEVVPTVVRDIPKVRDEINCRNAHLAFDLLNQCHEEHHFYYVAPDDQILQTYCASEVAISSLYFEPRCTSLFVGLSFGHFQIVDLKDLLLSFSSGINDFTGPITNFVFQEPENDPRNFCYLWVVQNSEDETLKENTLHGKMYQMTFAKKDFLKQEKKLKSLYSGLECCNARFQLSFDESFGLGPSVGSSKILQCSAIERYHSLSKSCNEDDYNSTPYTSVFLTTWVTTLNHRQSVHMLLFDVNCWYVAQMPASCRGFSDDEIFVTLWSLNCVINESEDEVLAACAAPSSLRHFHSNSHPTPRQFTYPSSYSLKTHCLTTARSMTCKLLGVQDQAIDHLLNAPSESLINPDYIFDQISTVGLADHCLGDVLTVDQKREAILSTALKHDVFVFLSRVISDLSTGEHAASGCSLRFILEWAWKQTAIIKDTIDTFCIPVFDCSVVTLDSTSRELLCRKITQIGNLHLVFKKLKEAEMSSQLSLLELDVKHNVILLIQDFLKILRWFIGARLLPEQLDEHLSFELNSYEEFHFVYKQKELRATYEERRSEIKEINRSPEPSLLMVDGLIEEAGQGLVAQWRITDDNSSAKYPPPSLYALLSMYYLDKVDEELKHTITTYFLLDILAVAEATNDNVKNSELFEATYHEHRKTVSYFPQTFQLPPSQTKLIKAFWLLDHGQFEESCWTFCEAGTERVTLPWQHRRILQAYMMQGHAEHALQYLVAHQPATSCVDDVKLHIDVLVKNRKLHHALNIAQVKGDPRNREVIYSHLFSSCYKHDLLPDLLKLSISKEEEELALKYLESSNIPHARDILVLLLLRRSRYLEAIRLYRKNMKPSIMTKHDEIEKGYHATLNHIVQGYLNFLPTPLKDYAHISPNPPHRGAAACKEVLPARPLSSVLNSASKSAPLSQAALLSLRIGKVKSVNPPLPMTPFRKKDTPSLSSNQDSNLNSSLRLFSTDLQSSENRRKSRKSMSSPSVFKRSSFGNAAELSGLSRLRDFASPISCVPLSGLEKKRSLLMESASVLLQTPPIPRSRRRSRNDPAALDVQTPQSILKVRTLGEKSSLTSTSQVSTPCRLTDPLSGSGSSVGDAVSGKLEFNDQGLDSSGSECETPAWMVPSITSQRKKTPKMKTFLNSPFNIETPTMAEIPRKSRVGFADTPRCPDSASSTKRLRFQDLNPDASFEERVLMKAKMQVASLACVEHEKTKENLEVTSTKSFGGKAISKPQTESKPGETYNLPPAQQDSLPDNSVIDKLQTVSRSPPSKENYDEAKSFIDGKYKETVFGNVPPRDVDQASDAEEEIVSEDIVLQLSDSSDHFDEVYPDAHACQHEDDVLEISTDEEFSSPPVHNLVPSPGRISLNLVPSQRTTEENRDSSPTPMAPTPSGSAPLIKLPPSETEDAPCGKPPSFPSLDLIDEEAKFQSASVSDACNNSEKSDEMANSGRVVKSAETKSDDIAASVTRKENSLQTESPTSILPNENCLVISQINEETSANLGDALEEANQSVQEDTEVIAPNETVSQVTSSENIKSTASEIRIEENLCHVDEKKSSENDSPKENFLEQNKPEIIVHNKSASEKPIDSSSLLKQSPLQSFSSDYPLPPSSTILVPPPSTSTNPDLPASSSTDPAPPLSSSADLAAPSSFPNTTSPSLSTVLAPPSSFSDPASPPSSFIDLARPPSSSIDSALPAIVSQTTEEVCSESLFKTPKLSHSTDSPSVEPTFFLSPPLTRSRTKKSQVDNSTVKQRKNSSRKVKKLKPPVFEPVTPDPHFVFSPPATRTRSHRKRKIDVTDNVTSKSKTPRLGSPREGAGKTPVTSSKRRAAKRTVSRTDVTSGKIEPRNSESEPVVFPSTDDDRSTDFEDQPTVTRTSSRRPQKNDVKESKNNVVSESSAANDAKDPVTPFPSGGTKLLRSHSKSAPNPAAPTPSTRSSSRIKELSINAPSSISRRTRASSVDVQPTVTNTSSRRKRRVKTSGSESEEASVVTRTSSRRRQSKVILDDYATSTATRSRSKPEPLTTQSHDNHIDQLDDIIEESETSSLPHSKPAVGGEGMRSIFPRRTDSSKVSRCPSNDKVRLLEVSSSEATVEYNLRRPIVTRSGKKFFPITARRKAKVYLWDKKRK